MPRVATGSVRFRDGRWRSRLTIASDRHELILSTCRPDDDEKASERSKLLGDLAAKLTAAGRADVALPLLERAASRDGKQRRCRRGGLADVCG